MKKGMKKVFAVITIMFFLFGCAGRTPIPVAEYQYGDDSKSCQHMKSELSQVLAEMDKKEQAKKNTAGKNATLFIVGLFFLWPVWFAMDPSGADQIEYEFVAKRHNALVRIANDKHCELNIQEVKIEPKKPVVVQNTNTEGY